MYLSKTLAKNFRYAQILVDGVGKRNVYLMSNVLEKNNEMKSKQINDEPPVPVTCCGSGCQNCVWIEYAENLLNYYNKKYSNSDAGLKKVLSQIEKLEDENLKTFLKLEISFKFKS